MFKLSCADMGMPECHFVAEGATKDEVMNKMKGHVTSAHPEMMKNASGEMKSDAEMQEAMAKMEAAIHN